MKILKILSKGTVEKFEVFEGMRSDSDFGLGVGLYFEKLSDEEKKDLGSFMDGGDLSCLDSLS